MTFRLSTHDICSWRVPKAAAAALFAEAFFLVWAGPSVAQTPPSPPSSGSTLLGSGSTLLGDVGGVRPALAKYGISLGVQTINDLLGNPTGGRAQGATNEGATEMSLGVDLQKAAGVKGGVFNVSAFQHYGPGLSACCIDNLNLVSSVEAIQSTYLFELWYQQSAFNGAIDFRVGQLAADQEFMITKYGSWFVNSAWGWPTLPSVDLPSGGPQYPLATPGVRLRVNPSGPLTWLLAAFNGDPAGPGLGNPQRRDATGALFRVSDGIFAISEVQYAMNGDKDAKGLPVTLKFGGWFHNKASPNQFFANDGFTVVPSIAQGSSIAQADWSAYAVLDAMLLPGPGGKGGLAAFARISAAPPERSQVSAELAGGLVYEGPFGRRKDQVGFGVTSVRVGQALGTTGALASEYRFRGYETVFELSYQMQVKPWLQVQPDVQYVFNPGGGIPDPNNPARQIGSALVLGVRTIVTF
jgi:porin